jgi:hypothetical protein
MPEASLSIAFMFKGLHGIGPDHMIAIQIEWVISTYRAFSKKAFSDILPRRLHLRRKVMSSCFSWQRAVSSPKTTCEGLASLLRTCAEASTTVPFEVLTKQVCFCLPQSVAEISGGRSNESFMIKENTRRFDQEQRASSSRGVSALWSL